MKNENKKITLPNVKIAEFEGPLDLLLHLIRIAEMDIYDIQISLITEQYLDYLHSQKELHLDIAGEYLLMAAKLTEIKGRMLLPVEAEDVEEDLDDPRDELVDQLIEYQQYQEASATLKEFELERQELYSRPTADIPEGLPISRLAPGVKVSDLEKAFKKIVARQLTSVPLIQTIQEDDVSVADRMEMVVNQIHLVSHPILFTALFQDAYSKSELVTTFMAILELAKDEIITIYQIEDTNEIYIDNRNEKNE